MIILSGSGLLLESEFGPIKEDEIWNCPLLQSSASRIKIKPYNFLYLWSQEVSCNLQTHDFTSMRDVHCDGEIKENKFIKIGSTEDIKKRAKDLNKNFGNFVLLDVFETNFFRDVESNILEQTTIKKNLHTF